MAIFNKFMLSFVISAISIAAMPGDYSWRIDSTPFTVDNEGVPIPFGLQSYGDAQADYAYHQGLHRPNLEREYYMYDANKLVMDQISYPSIGQGYGPRPARPQLDYRSAPDPLMGPAHFRSPMREKEGMSGPRPSGQVPVPPMRAPVQQSGGRGHQLTPEMMAQMEAARRSQGGVHAGVRMQRPPFEQGAMSGGRQIPPEIRAQMEAAHRARHG